MTIEEADLCRTQALINHGIKDFSGAYMAVKYVAGHMDKHPDTIDVDTVKTLTDIIRSPRFEHQTHRPWLFQSSITGIVHRILPSRKSPDNCQ